MAATGESLSDRELAVLECLVDGSTNREIAQNLHISHNTVKVHLRNIFAKLGVNSRTEATAVALQMGLLSLPGLETTEETDTTETAESSPTETAEVEPVSPAVDSQPVLTQPEKAVQSPWRLLSLALVGLLLLAGLTAITIRFINNNTDSGETQAPLEVPIGDTRWFISTPLPEPTSNMALATVGLNLYQIGGEIPAGVVNLVNI
ncbi:MAG: response regulator transcription factor, partial [Candidatus Promineifilaceae bacterium]